MKRLSLISIFIVSVFVLSAQGAFDAVIENIVANNGELLAQRHLIVAQSLDDADENSLADPEVSFARVWGRHAIGNKLQLDITQSFDWPGVYKARSQANQMRELVGLAEYAATEFELVNQARALLVELVFVRHQIAVIDDMVNNFKSLGEAIDQGVRGGELTILDQRKMQIENFEIDNDMTNARVREKQIIAAINALTTSVVDLSAITEYPVQPLLARDEYLDQVNSDPNVQVQVLIANQEDANVMVAKQSRLPGWSVGYQHQAEMGDRFNGFTVAVTLPVFQNRHARQAALQRQAAAVNSQDMIVAKRRAEINSTYDDLEAYRERLQVYNRTFGDKMYLELLLKAYKGGQISVIDYLSEVHYYHQTMLLYLESEYNYNLALSNLNCYR